MFKESYEFETRYSDIERNLQERKEKETKKRFKTCSKCGERKSLLYFAVDRRSSDGRTGDCKTCRSRESSEYYYQNREQILIKVKEYQETHKEGRSVYFENYQRDHKEHLKKVASKRYKKNKKAIKKRNLKYYQENKEACRIRRGLWLEKNKERVKKYNREYKKLKSRASQG